MQHSDRSCGKVEALALGMGRDLTEEELATICGGQGPQASGAAGAQGSPTASTPPAPGSLGSLGALSSLLKNGLPDLNQLLEALGLGGLGL